jgi:hypothetical protein
MVGGFVGISFWRGWEVMVKLIQKYTIHEPRKGSFSIEVLFVFSTGRGKVA